MQRHALTHLHAQRLLAALLLVFALAVTAPLRAAIPGDCATAQAAQANGDNLGALTRLQHCVENQLVAVAETWVDLGRAAAGRSDHRVAESHYDRALAVVPGHPPALTFRGYSRAMAGAVDSALEDLGRAISAAPDRAEPYFYRARAFMQTERYDAALVDLDTAIRLAPEDPLSAPLYYYRSEIYRQSSDLPSAVADLTRAIDLDGTQVTALFARAEVFDQQKRYTDAVVDYGRVIDLQPENVDALYARAVVHKKLRNDHLALRDFEAVIRLKPTSAKAHARRGYTYLFPLLPVIAVLVLGL